MRRLLSQATLARLYFSCPFRTKRLEGMSPRVKNEGSYHLVKSSRHWVKLRYIFDSTKLYNFIYQATPSLMPCLLLGVFTIDWFLQPPREGVNPHRFRFWKSKLVWSYDWVLHSYGWIINCLIFTFMWNCTGLVLSLGF